MQRHLSGHAWQRLHQEVGCSHPGLDRSERMLNRLTPLAHFFRMLVEPALNGLENLLMLPTRDPSLFAGGAAVLDVAALASVGPVAMQNQPMFLVREMVGEPFTGRADVDILLCHVTKVLLAEIDLRILPPRSSVWAK